MLKFFIFFTIGITIVCGQTRVSRPVLRNHIHYWEQLMQQLIYELEAREWCNLKLDDITQTINDNLFNLSVNGTVYYTNGFVISIQKIDLTNIRQSVDSRKIDDVDVPFGSVRGMLNFRHLMLGHDVYANLIRPAGEYRSTGTFLHTLVELELDITQNLVTKEYSSSPRVVTTSVGSGVRMQFMPSSNITEAIGRRFSHSTFDSARKWAVDTFVPIMIDIATNKLEFPEVCYNHCT